MSTLTYDVVVVGAGIVGAACAEECARQGMRVAVIDRDVIGGGATAAGMGHIVVMDDSEAQFALTRYSQQLWQQLRPDLTPDVEYEQCGTIWVAADEDDMAEVRRQLNFYLQRRVPAEMLDTKRLELLEPNLRKGLAGGLLVPDDAVLYPPCAARLLIDRAQAAGAKIHLGGAVTQIGKGRVCLADGKQFAAAIIINATGAWAAELTPGVTIKKRKGHLAITDRYPSFLLQRAQQYMPQLAHMSTIRVWTGFRAATPDKLPLIGPLPADPTVFLATGHEGLGITTSLATARLLVDQITGRNPTIPVAPYLPSRVSTEHAYA